MSDTLAPCPYCGHEGNEVSGEPGMYEILCAGCDHACFAYFHTRTMATAAWNTRTAPVEGKPVPDWSQAPEWAMFWTRDVSGVTMWWEAKPIYDGRMGIWMCDDEGQRARGTDLPILRKRP